MKIYMLVTLIGVLVGLSHISIRVPRKQADPAPPDSLAA
jgi:hypothetical protein